MITEIVKSLNQYEDYFFIMINVLFNIVFISYV